jgi:hypothetical protein
MGMKKILSLILILGLLGIIVYVLGLVKLSVEPGNIGVIATRTNGFEPIKSDSKTIVWDIRHVLPFNFEVLSFSTDFQRLEFKFQDLLPQALSLASLVEEDVNVFAYHLEGSLHFRLREDALISELQRGALKADELDQYYNQQSTQINSLLSEVFIKSMDNLATVAKNNAAFSHITQAFLEKALPHLEFEALTFTVLELPNISLYHTAMDNLLSKTEISLKAYQQITLATEQAQLEHQQRLQMMRDYGQILTDFPILIPYFALIQGSNIPIDLADFMPDFSKLFSPQPVTAQVTEN